MSGGTRWRRCCRWVGRAGRACGAATCASPGRACVQHLQPWPAPPTASSLQSTHGLASPPLPLPPRHPPQDEERGKRAQNVVPTWSELNAQWARGPEELELFDRLDRDLQVGWGCDV